MGMRMVVNGVPMPVLMGMNDHCAAPPAPDAVLTAAITNSGTGCTATYYTTNGSTPTTASTRYTGPFVIKDSTIVKFFSVDNAGNVEGVQLESYVNRKSSVGSIETFTLVLCIFGISIRYYRNKYRRLSN